MRARSYGAQPPMRAPKVRSYGTRPSLHDRAGTFASIGRNAHKDGPQTEIEAYTEATHGSNSEIITCMV